MNSAPTPQTPGYLKGWKAIARFLECDPTTAQRYEREAGLPVHRPAGQGKTVVAYPSELEAWVAGGRPEEAEIPRPRLGKRLWLAVALVLATGATAGLLFLGRNLAPRPARVVPEGPLTRVFDAQGKELWRVISPAGTQPSPYTPPLLEDLDGDGSPEILIRLTPTPDNPQKASPFQVYSVQGRLVWAWQEESAVPGGRSIDGRPWVNVAFAVVRRPGSRVAWVAVASISAWGSTATVVVLDPSGKVRGRYFHRGHLYTLVPADVDGDGLPELLAAGVNDASDKNQAVLVVLDPARLTGSSGGWRKSGTLDYPSAGPAMEKQVFHFERSLVSRGKPFNSACAIRNEQGGIAVVLHEEGSCGVGPTLIYHFEPSMALRHVQMIDATRLLMRDMEKRGLAKPGSTETEPQRLAALLEVHPEPSGEERKH